MAAKNPVSKRKAAELGIDTPEEEKPKPTRQAKRKPKTTRKTRAKKAAPKKVIPLYGETGQYTDPDGVKHEVVLVKTTISSKEKLFEQIKEIRDEQDKLQEVHEEVQKFQELFRDKTQDEVFKIVEEMSEERIAASNSLSLKTRRMTGEIEQMRINLLDELLVSVDGVYFKSVIDSRDMTEFFEYVVDFFELASRIRLGRSLSSIS